jgi:hypothetical protein
MSNPDNPISFRAGRLDGELRKRGNPSLAAKFATRRYLALVAQYQADAHDRFSEADRAFLHREVFPVLPLDSDSTFEMIAAWAERQGADETLARKLRKASPGEIDALIDEWRQQVNATDTSAAS